MIVKKGLLLCCICFSMCLLSCNHNNEVGVQDVTKNTVTSKNVPTVCLYTLGNVSKNLREAMLDSLKVWGTKRSVYNEKHSQALYF